MSLTARSVNRARGDPSPPTDRAELPPALRAHLLDPAHWRESLETFARATNLAVALTDEEGRLLGECQNPQKTWLLLHAHRPSAGRPPPESGTCPFSLALLDPCTCVADALATGGVVTVRDRTGLVHFAVPLRLGEQLLGALVAGQVFDQYPEQLPLEQAAKAFGVPPGDVWRSARLEHPVKQATLRVYADLLANLARTSLQSRHQIAVEADRLAEMTRLRNQLAEADLRKNQFLAMLGHELRNPLAPLRNALHILQRLGPDQPDTTWATDVIERQTALMTRLVNDLLDVSRITSGKVRLHKEPVNVAAVVARAVEMSRQLLDDRRHELTVALPDEPAWLDADPMRLTQVLANLLNNASKYTDEGGRIRLTVEREGGEAVLRVRDTGVGIAAEMLPRVFDLFTQADHSLAHAQGGLGIGLTMVHSLVEMHGGSVRGFSAGLGQGSEFVVRLPLLAEPPAAADAEEEDNGLRIPPSPRRVLVVDDNRDGSNSLALLLKMRGHEVQVAHDGATALVTALAMRPEVVLLDIGLPDLDGYEVARRLRNEAGTKEALLVALTGYGQEDDRRRSREAGFDHHLVKPVDFDDVQALLAAGEMLAPATR